MRRQRGQELHAPVWGLTRLRALLALGTAAALLAVAGIMLAVAHRHIGATSASLGAGTHGTPATAASSASNSFDELAARAMPTFGLDSALPQAASTREPGPALVLPRSSRVGDAGVATGFPQTVEGALAQLAAIDQAALESASPTLARDVVTHWVAPGGPDASTWSVLRTLVRLLDAAGVNSGSTSGLTVAVTPVMGLIKGAVGPDFVVPCVDFEIDVTVTQTARAAIADCARMVWRLDRWLIGTGPEPADPPSVWPDTDLAFSVGYRDVRHG